MILCLHTGITHFQIINIYIWFDKWMVSFWVGRQTFICLYCVFSIYYCFKELPPKVRGFQHPLYFGHTFIVWEFRKGSARRLASDPHGFRWAAEIGRSPPRGPSPQCLSVPLHTALQAEFFPSWMSTSEVQNTECSSNGCFHIPEGWCRTGTL